mgnify:CR=1 FL=1
MRPVIWGSLVALAVIAISGCPSAPAPWTPGKGGTDGRNHRSDLPGDGDSRVRPLGDADLAVGSLDNNSSEQLEEMHCPNGKCEPEKGENGHTCWDDCCSTRCGDGLCDTAGCDETIETCCTDCSGCGNGVCSPCETPSSCPEDCCGSCGDSKCIGSKCEEPVWCPKDCGTACGNKTCDAGELPLCTEPEGCPGWVICPEDCAWKVCGDGICSPEDLADDQKCLADCGTGCGNGNCETGESWLDCPIDCGFCGDRYCVLLSGESPLTCPSDCE